MSFRHEIEQPRDSLDVSDSHGETEPQLEPLGRVIGALLDAREESLESFSSRTGIPLSTIYKIAHLKRHPGADTIKQFAEALGTSVSYLFGEVTDSDAHAVEVVSTASMGDTIKSLVHEKRLTQWQLARKSGLKPGVVYRTLHSKTSPKEGTVRQLAKGLGVPVGALFGERLRTQNK